MYTKNDDFLIKLNKLIEDSKTLYKLSNEEFLTLEKLSNHRYKRHRIEVANILGMVKSTEQNKSILLKMLFDDDWIVRCEAAESIAFKVDDSDGLEALKKAIVIETNIKSLDYMIYSITQMGLKNIKYQIEIKKIITDVLKKAKNYDTRYSCYYCLIQLGDEKYFKMLLDALKDKNPYKIEQAIKKLQDILDDEEYLGLNKYASSIKNELVKIPIDLEQRFRYSRKLLTHIYNNINNSGL